MSTVTKNPIILQSAMYVYNWFLSKLKDGDEAKIFNILEEVDSDKYIVNTIKKREEDKKKYENFDLRKRNVEEHLNEYIKQNK